MNADQDRAKSIFLNAAELATPAEQEAYLAAACGNNCALRAEVVGLLKHHVQAGAFLEACDPNFVATAAEPDLSERPGALIGPYKLLEQLGEGGFGIVYLAEQTQPVRRKVALKVLKPGMDTRQVIARFEAERQTLAILDHPNIAKVFDGGATSSGRPYFVMELVKGVPITEFCDRQHLTLRQRLELFIAVCQAVQHAHQKAIIHRDLKPSNVLVSRLDTGPVVKVIDFGVAKALGQALTDKTLFTACAQMIGTPLYMSPEQTGMSDLDVDTRSDIYSLGVLLYELLTGTTPFNKEQFQKAGYDEIRRIIREEEPPRPSTRLSGSTDALSSISAQRQTEPAKLTKLLRGELDWIVMKALEKDRSRRYETANGFALDVQRYLADEPVQACPPSAAYRFRKLVRRNKAVVITAALIAALLVVGTAVSTWLALCATDAEGLAEERLVGEKVERQRAEQAERAGRHRLYDARQAEAQASRWSGRAGRRFRGLQALREAAQLARDLKLAPAETLKLRNEAIACMALVDLRLDRKWPGYPSGSTSTGIAFDREMQRYARIDGNGHISVRRFADNQEVLRITDTGAPAAPKRAPDWRMYLLFSPNGRFLAAAGDSRFGVPLQLWDLQTRKSLLKVAPAGYHDFSRTIDFSPDNRVLAARCPDGLSISLYDVQTARELQRFRLGRPIRYLRFHPQGDRLAVCSGSQVHVLNRSGSPMIPPLDHPHNVMDVAWNADAQLLATGCGDGHAYIWDAASGKQQTICKGHQGGVINVAFGRRGDLLATTAEDETTRLWDPWSGKDLLSTNGLGSEFSEGDRWLGLGVFGHEVGRWEVATGGEYRSLQGHSRAARVSCLAVSPDGRLLASAARDGVRLWDVVSGKATATLPTGETASAIFDRSGRFLLTSAASGLYRWPIQLDTAGPSARYRIGTPERVPVPAAGRPHCASLSPDGQTLALHIRGSRHAVVFNLARPTDRPRSLSPANVASISPDAKWVATTLADAHEGKLWDAQTGKWLRDFPGIRTADVAFSPDNRWLSFATAAEYRFYRVGSWEAGPRVARDSGGYGHGWLAFSSDGRIAAIAHTPRVIKLIDCADGQEIATLAAPVPEELCALCFTPNGSHLAAGTTNGVIQLWDLRRIRKQLAELGLDWDQALYPPAPPSGDASPIRVEVANTQFVQPAKARDAFKQGEAHARAMRWGQAIASYTQAIELDPAFANAYARRGFAYNKLMKSANALADYARAIELDPNNPTTWNNRGWVYARLRQWDQAIANYSESLRLLPNSSVTLGNRGIAYADSGQFEKADADFVRVSQLSADSWGPAELKRALLRLLRGDQIGYRTQCAALLKRTAGDLPLSTTKCVAEACVLAPDAGVDVDQLLRLAERVRAAEPKRPESVAILGAALYRAGRYAEAAKRLTEAEAAYARAQQQAPRHVWLFLAMTQHRLGHGDQARRWLDQVLKTGESPRQTWYGRGLNTLLRLEAEKLLKQRPGETN